MTYAMFAVFIINLLLGLPLFVCMLLAAAVGFLFIDPSLFMNALPQRFFGGMDVFSLMAIPLFILAGNLMNNSGMTPRLIRLANTLVGHFRGGLGHVNVVAGVFFAGVNGSAAADASALSTLLVPARYLAGEANTSVRCDSASGATMVTARRVPVWRFCSADRRARFHTARSSSCLMAYSSLAA